MAMTHPFSIGKLSNYPQLMIFRPKAKLTVESVIGTEKTYNPKFISTMQRLDRKIIAIGMPEELKAGLADFG
jgi:hypothetical protein